ncbi:hypothetical protein U9M73_05525 [Paenibacillus phoenicis]|uniref:YqzE family protein n=1 Tax=Paenibacillus phoenicis TaxID=554117 RepID=A0ABU5PHN3_9BACL|nr:MULTISPECIES: hypothetical protein [Paenibacillus]MCT2193964.1 hypothetical protein [Paenibacillus sp. p3-SID1389]MEA3569456.1 hypothetical protein [Paenibacillus phoenicis]
MNYQDFYVREREIKEFHQLLKRPGNPNCFEGMTVPKRSVKKRKRANGMGKVLRSILNMFY